jgi:hypothetical protein
MLEDLYKRVMSGWSDEKRMKYSRRQPEATEVRTPISFAMSFGFVQVSKSEFGMASRFDGVSIVVGRIPITESVSKYSLCF